MKSLIPQKVHGYRHAVINRLIDHAYSTPIIAGPGLLARESTIGTRLELDRRTLPVNYKPFDVRLWPDPAGVVHVLVYAPQSYAPIWIWNRGNTVPGAWDANTVAATTAWPNSGQGLPDGLAGGTSAWIDSDLTFEGGGGAMNIYASVRFSGASNGMVLTSGTLWIDDAVNATAEGLSLERWLCSIDPNGNINQFFNGPVYEYIMPGVPL